MQPDLLDLYRRAGEWCGEKVAGAANLDTSTPCDDWNVRDLLNHMLETQHYFAGSGAARTCHLPARPRRHF